jgi:hypothetical protein
VQVPLAGFRIAVKTVSNELVFTENMVVIK